MTTKLKTRNLQEIFQTVIAHSYYSCNKYPFMCVALKEASYDCVITYKERDKAIRAIDTYLTKLGVNPAESYDTLIAALNHNCKVNILSLPKDPTYLITLAVYLNWKARPTTPAAVNRLVTKLLGEIK